MAKRDLCFRFLYRGIFLLITVLLCFGRLSGGEVVIDNIPIQAFNQNFTIIPESPAKMASITASTDGDWNDLSTWSGGIVPTSADDVTIPDGITVTISSASAECNSLNISGELNLTDNYNLTIADQLTLNGEITTDNGSVILSNPAQNALTYTSGSITGNFRRSINPAVFNYLFPLGDGSNPAMLQLNFASITEAGEITVATTETLPSGFALNPSTATGKISISTNTVVFSTVSGTYTPSAWTSNQRVGLYNGVWSYNQPPGPTASFSGWNSLNGAAFVLADCVEPNSPTNNGNQSICVGQTIPDLTVTVNTGETVDWYISASGGTPLTSNTLSYTPAGAGTFYAETRNTTTGCTSTSRTAVALTINSNPNNPTSNGDKEICANETIPALTVTVNSGETVDWYSSASGGTPIATNSLGYTPTTAGNYYAEARNTTTGCISSTRTEVSLTIYTNPSPPVSGGNNEICAGETIPPLTVSVISGETVDWYSSVSGGTLLESNNLSYTPTGAGTFYAETRNTTTGCTSTSRTAVTLTINSNPNNPTSNGDKEICANETIPALTVNVNTGETVDWFSSASGGAPLVSGSSSYFPATDGTFYAEARNTTTGCTSTSRTAVSLNILPQHTLILNSAPSTVDQEVCINQPITTISYIFGGGATSVTINNLPPNVTYNISGNSVNITGSPNEVNTYNYSISTIGNNCSSVTLSGSIQVDLASVAGIASPSKDTICYNTSSSLSLSGYVGDIQWHQSDNISGPWVPVAGGTGQNTANYTTPNLTSNTYYKAVVTNGVCATVSSNIITIQIDSTPPNFEVPAPIEIPFGANCTYSALPTITGQPNPMNFSDNCGTDGLQISYNDSIIQITNCDTVKIYRKWTLKDQNNNQTTKIQLITAVDKQAPSLQNPTAIGEITIHCNQSTDPSVTGTPVFTDNCDSSPEVTYSDSDITPVPNSCDNNYSFIRTWTAEDCSGNITTRTQKIIVRDNTPPTASIPEMFIDMSTEHIPFAFEDLLEFQTIGNGTFNDNCTTVPFFATIFDRAYGLEAMPGYCPDSVIRVYRITDLCGNFVDVKHKITITNKGNCNPCDYNNTHTIDFYNDLDTSLTIRLGRDNKCCDPNLNGNVYCIAFNIRLHPDAVGLEILVQNGAPDVKEWKLECDTLPVSGGIVCIPGGDFHLFTFCKQGTNENNFTIRSISGVSTDENAYARIGGDCNTQLHVEGVTTPVWQSIFPDTPGAYDGFLSDISSTDPLFTPGPDSPPFIDYKVCGSIGSSPCVTGGIDCDTIRVYVKDTIHYTFNVDPEQICGTFYPELIPTIEPASNYTIEWFSGYDKSGTSYGIRNTFTPTLPGPYSVEVIDYQNTLYPCSRRVFNFDVAQDNQPPIVVAPEDLILECNDLANPQLIANWLITATATDRQEPVNVTDNYSGISQFCNNEITVVFTATDNCGNTGTDEAKIIIRDTTAPYWLDAPNALDVNINCHDEPALLAAQLLEPSFNDDCESNLKAIKSSGPVPTDECLNGKTIVNTWVVTDACGNTSDVFTQTITLIDNTPPTIVYCPPAASNAADIDECYTTTLVLGTATATDDCGTATVTNNLLALFPSGEIPVGQHTITWTATDACNLTATCTQEVTIIDEQDPVIDCPDDVTATAPAPECVLEETEIDAPTITDNCGLGYTLTWKKEGATEDTGTGDVNGTSFNVGVTIVIYTVTDAAGNKAECSFNVTINDLVPPTVLTCPVEDISVNAETGLCDAFVTIPKPTAEDPCMEIVSISTESPYRTSETDASGRYPVGTHEVVWIITDISLNTSTCEITVTVIDNQNPTITCPTNITQPADYGLPYNDQVIVPEGSFGDNCSNPQLSWTFTPAPGFEGEYTSEQLSGTGFYPSPSRFYLGQSIINYTVTDASGNPQSCSFTITITSKPDITCADDIFPNTDDGECDATLNPGVPTLVEGAQPIDWTWILTNPDGTTISGNSTTTDSNPIPSPIVTAPPHEYDFQLRTTSIYWKATNLSGFDECTQIITVIDNQDPEYTLPTPPPFCVENLNLAFFNGTGLDIEPIPDHYLHNSTDLDLIFSVPPDNCGCPPTEEILIEWTITFDIDTPYGYGGTSISGTGQPSLSSIYLWGDGENYKTLVHNIVFTVTDCNDNTSVSDPVGITITPRPQIIKN